MACQEAAHLDRLTFLVVDSVGLRLVDDDLLAIRDWPFEDIGGLAAATVTVITRRAVGNKPGLVVQLADGGTADLIFPRRSGATYSPEAVQETIAEIDRRRDQAEAR